MIRIYPEQLAAQLNAGLHSSYLLCGNEPLLLQESLDRICRRAHQQQFTERLDFVIDAQIDWDLIFSYCQALSLFSSQKILTLQLPDNGVNPAIAEKLLKLTSLLNSDILLIIQVQRLTKAQENGAWFKALGQNSVFISCQTPEQAHLPRWVTQRAKSMLLDIDEQAVQLLCYNYEGNLLALAQALERLALLYPDTKLTLLRVEEAVSDAAHFTPYNWLDALLAGKTKRAWHILQQLRLADMEALILVRTLQKELLQLLQLHNQMQQTPLKTLFDRQKIWQNRRPLISQALQRLSAEQLQRAVALLTHIELRLKQDYSQSIWPELESILMLLCGKSLPGSLI